MQTNDKTGREIQSLKSKLENSQKEASQLKRQNAYFLIAFDRACRSILSNEMLDLPSRKASFRVLCSIFWEAQETMQSVLQCPADGQAQQAGGATTRIVPFEKENRKEPRGVASKPGEIQGEAPRQVEERQAEERPIQGAMQGDTSERCGVGEGGEAENLSGVRLERDSSRTPRGLQQTLNRAVALRYLSWQEAQEVLTALTPSAGSEFVTRPKIVCICGSTRFVGEMAVEAWKLEKQGIIVLGPHLLPSWYEGVQESHQAEAEGVAHILDELHLRKIDLADEVLVVNCAIPGHEKGYIGKRTRIEIDYAKKLGKPVNYLITVEDK